MVYILIILIQKKYLKKNSLNIKIRYIYNNIN